MKCNFVVGQRVICIPNAYQWNVLKTYPKVAVPECNGIYTIRNIEVFNLDGDEDIGLRFVELINPICLFFDFRTEPAFSHSQFRALNERSTSIEILKKLERPNKPKVVLKEPTITFS
jgi:hypothetical protein